MSEPQSTAAAEIAELNAGAAQLRVRLDAGQVKRCLQLIDALEAGNTQFNLSAIRDRTGMLQKHVLDSMSVVPFLHGTRVADIGTGAGYPGLVLAVAVPASTFTLIEATGKKARFVEQTVQQLELANVRVVNSRAEIYRPFELFDTVVSRALASLADFVAYAGHLCAPDGRLLAMKGRQPDDEIAALPRSFRVVAVHRLRVPGLFAERHLVQMAPAHAKPSRT